MTNTRSFTLADMEACNMLQDMYLALVETNADAAEVLWQASRYLSSNGKRTTNYNSAAKATACDHCIRARQMEQSCCPFHWQVK